MQADLEAEFLARYEAVPEVVARAPGRVNLIGEHTDYNEGLVLPCAIDRSTWVGVRRRADSEVRIYSREFDAEGRFKLGTHHAGGNWVDYAKGVFAALEARGLRPGGFEIAVVGDIPPGSGLSSSAAFTVALVTAIDRAMAFGLDDRTRCDIAHAAETEFVGVPCGIMDQYACTLARSNAALRIDCRSRDVEHVPWPEAQLGLLIAHSGVRRSLADGGLAARRDECAAALTAARDAGVAPAGARALRDLGEEHLSDLSRVLGGVAFRRARHVIRENARVDAACASLAAGDLAATGRLLSKGMESLREDFDVSTPELDALCDLADAMPAVYGSRLTGAGFGGCTIHLVEPAAAESVAVTLADGFETRFGRRPTVWAVRPADGAHVVE